MQAAFFVAGPVSNKSIPDSARDHEIYPADHHPQTDKTDEKGRNPVHLLVGWITEDRPEMVAPPLDPPTAEGKTDAGQES